MIVPADGPPPTDPIPIKSGPNRRHHDQNHYRRHHAMQTHHMSRSIKLLEGHKVKPPRGRGGPSRSTLLDFDRLMTRRRFRRANKLTHAEAEAIELLIRGSSGPRTLPLETIGMDDLARMIEGMSRKI